MVRVVRRSPAGTGREEAAPTELSPIELLAGAAAGVRRAARPSLSSSSSRSANAAAAAITTSSSTSSSPLKRHITRNRPVQSCIECRKRKHKCDRQKPVCQHCIATGRKERCVYRDDRPKRRHGAQDANATLAATRPVEVHNGVVVYAAPVAGQSTALHTRLASVRSQALIEVLDQHTDLQLPSLDEADALFRLWRNSFESLVRCAMSDLNVPRYERCLVWWHTRNGTLDTMAAAGTSTPAPDPSSFPLMLVVLAHCLQIKRSAANATAATSMPPPSRISSERKLIRVAGDCIDALQAACPPSWAAAFTAPIDLIKAAALRGRWFLHGVRYQMAGTCFSAAVHLACAAGLHRDPRHWPAMRAEEGEARRQLWWYVVSECLAANRLEQFSVLLPDPVTFDTDLPVEPAAIENQQTDAIRAYVDSVLLHRRLPFVFDAHEFHYHTAKHRWAKARLQRTMYGRNEGIPLPAARVAELDALHAQLITAPTLPHELHWTDEQDDELARMITFDATANNVACQEQRHFLQRAMLHLEYNLSRLELHMPRIAAVPEESLAVCLGATQALVAIVAGLLNVHGLPPVLIEPFLHAALMTGMVLTLAMGGGGGSQGSEQHSAVPSALLAPLLRRLLRALFTFQQTGAVRQDANVAEYAAKVRNFLADLSSRAGNSDSNSGDLTPAALPLQPPLSDATTPLPSSVISNMELGGNVTEADVLSDWSTSPSDPFFSATTATTMTDTLSMDMDMSGLWREWQAFYNGFGGGHSSGGGFTGDGQ